MREPPPEPIAVEDGGRPWGLWPTVGFAVLIVILWIAAQGIATVLLLGGRAGGSDAFSQGWIVARVAIVSAPIVIGGALLLARARKGIGVAAYLGLTWPGARQALRWSLLLLGFIVASDSLGLAFGRPLVPESMISAYRTAGSLPIFLLGIVVAAPLAEEFLFRGFLFAGLANSRLRPSGAIALTALAWGTLHVQYDVYTIVTVVVGGILLGLARWRTGSLWLCALLHGLMNVVATVEVMFVLSRR
jgi:membrane protease YdiL (CAAX protease family)